LARVVLNRRTVVLNGPDRIAIRAGDVVNAGAAENVDALGRVMPQSKS
jgi:hypothetical protein